jgi:hypothetical protein
MVGTSVRSSFWEDIVTVRRKRPVDEATLLGLLMKGDFAEFAKVTGSTVQQVERMLNDLDDRDEFEDDEDEDYFFDDGYDEEDEKEARYQRPA